MSAENAMISNLHERIANDWHQEWIHCWNNVPTNLPADFPRDRTHESHRPVFIEPIAHDIIMRTCGTIHPSTGKCPSCVKMKAASSEITWRLIEQGNPRPISNGNPV